METKNIRVTVWNEYLHEKLDPAVAKYTRMGYMAASPVSCRRQECLSKQLRWKCRNTV